jgi:sulfite dehydrogenase (cytochrome) subunit B
MREESMHRIAIMMAAASLAFTTAAAADDVVKKGTGRIITLPPPAVTLREGAGMEVTRGYCAICHSLDYITTQPQFPRARWQAEVTKMIKVYGAAISDADAKIITDYITASYGRGE